MNDESTRQRAQAWDKVWDLLCLLDPQFPFSQIGQGAYNGTTAAIRAIEEYHRLAVKGITEANAVADRLRGLHRKDTEDLTKRLGMRKLEVKRLSKALRLSVLERRALNEKYHAALIELADAQEALAQNRANQNYQEGYSEGLADGLREVEGQ